MEAYALHRQARFHPQIAKTPAPELLSPSSVGWRSLRAYSSCSCRHMERDFSLGSFTTDNSSTCTADHFGRVILHMHQHPPSISAGPSWKQSSGVAFYSSSVQLVAQAGRNGRKCTGSAVCLCYSLNAGETISCIVLNSWEVSLAGLLLVASFVLSL